MSRRHAPTVNQQLSRLAQTLRIALPGTRLPLITRLIVVFTLIGGLSIVGSLFVDIGRPSASISSRYYLLRLVIGVIAIASAYGIIKRRQWALWLYAVITLIGFILNPITALVPGLALIYLTSQSR